MADNVPITPGTGVDIGADEVASVKYQRTKVVWGPDGTVNDTDVASGKMLPVQLRDSDGTDVALTGKLGGLTETAPATDTASSGLNGRLQRIAQRLTSLIALLPTALGAQGGLKVEGVASGTAVPISATQLPAALAAGGGMKIEGVAGGVAVPISAASLPSHAVTNIGTFATQVDGAALTALQLIDDSVKQDDAGFTVGTDKATIAGGVVVAHGSAPDAADAADAGAILLNRHRVQFTIGGHPNVTTIKHTTITTAVTDAAIITISTGLKIVVTAITATLDNASTVFPTILVGFGSANTPTTTGVILAHGGTPAGGGVNRGDGSGMLGVGGDGEDLRVTTTGNATGNGLQIVVTYYTIDS